MEEFLAIRWMCSTTTDLPTGGVRVEACMGLLLLPEPQANVATKCTHSPSSRQRWCRAPLTRHLTQPLGKGMLILFHTWGNWRSSEHQSHITSESQTAASRPNPRLLKTEVYWFPGISMDIRPRATFTLKWQHWVSSCGRDRVARGTKILSSDPLQKRSVTHTFGNNAAAPPRLRAQSTGRLGRVCSQEPQPCPISPEHKSALEQYFLTCLWNIPKSWFEWDKEVLS